MIIWHCSIRSYSCQYFVEIFRMDFMRGEEIFVDEVSLQLNDGFETVPQIFYSDRL